MEKRDHIKLKTLIKERLDELVQEDNLGYGSQAIVELDQQSLGRLSRMDALQSQAMAKSQKRRRQGMRQALEVALQRLDTDEFGYCDECGDIIPLNRLMANPIITKCISCMSL